MSAAPRTPSRPHRHRARQPSGSTLISTPVAATPVTTGNTATYAAQLHASILATRESILTAHSTADANRSAALGGLDVARHTFADARYGLKNAVANRAVVAFLDQKIGDANETALNTVGLAQSSNTRAQTAASTMNDAASSIKAAASAVEAVIVDVNGVAGVTNVNDGTDAINNAAHDAVDAVANLGKAIDELKCLALIANVQAACPRTAPVVQATQANQSNLSNLLATFDATLKTAVAAVTDAQTARTTDLNDLFAQSETFTVAASDDQALGKAITKIDSVSNDSLTAVVQNSSATAVSEPATADEKRPGKSSREKGAAARATTRVVPGDEQTVAGFKASWTLAAPIQEQTVAMTCFVVPVADAPSFDFQAAITAVTAGNCETMNKQEGQPFPAEGSLSLLKDSNGDPVRFGEQYRIFALRSPDEAHGPQTATHFSFPTPPITSTVLLTFPGAPQVYPPPASGSGKQADPLPHNAIVAIFPAASPLESIDSHRLFFAPIEVIEKEQDAELIIADALNAASFSELPTKYALTNIPDNLAHTLWKQIYSEVPSGGKRPPPVPDAFESWVDAATEGTGPFFVVYLSPFATTEGFVKDKGFFVGRYTDMYGDLLDIEERAYEAYALAVGKENQTLDGQEAANVLSDPSPGFPSNVQVGPLPTDNSVKPSKE